jgi:8-oxo-dGTP diphosphatase
MEVPKLPKPFGLSAKVIIHDDSGRCLLLKRSLSSKGNPGKWDLPGGKVDSAETFEHALLREVAEETGLSISLGRVLGAAESESPTKRVAYLILEGHLESGQVCLSNEHSDFAWVGCQELASVDMAEQFRSFLKAYSQMDK